MKVDYSFAFAAENEATAWNVDDIIREVSTRESVNADDMELFSNADQYIDYYRRDYTI